MIKFKVKKKSWRQKPVSNTLKCNCSNIAQNRFGLFFFKKKRRKRPTDSFPVSWGKGLCPDNLPGLIPTSSPVKLGSQGYSTESALYLNLSHRIAPKNEEPEKRIQLQIGDKKK